MIPPQDSNKKNLDAFRKATYNALIEKGIQPPAQDSKEEQNLFEQWLRGFNALHGNE